jgi:glycosyltransferase involved in cell wall biosynthesis
MEEGGRAELRGYWHDAGHRMIGQTFGYARMAEELRRALEPKGWRWVRRAEDADIVWTSVMPGVFRRQPVDRPHVLVTMLEHPEVNADNRRGLDDADLVLTPSQWCRSILLAETGTPVAAIGLGVDASTFREPEPERPRVLPFRWLYLGAPNFRKGVDVLTQAWNDHFAQHANVELYIKTTHPKVPEKIERELNVITDWRRLTTPKLVTEIYHRAHAFVFPTGGEGWGMCVDPATMIQVPGGAKPMAEIAPGDSVLAGDGTWRMVLAKTQREAETLRCATIGASVTVTPEHPFLALRRRSDPHAYYARHTDERPAWTRADALKPGDWVAVGAPEHSEPMPATFDLAGIALARGGLVRGDEVAARMSFEACTEGGAADIGARLGITASAVSHRRQRGTAVAMAIPEARRRWVQRYVGWTDEVLEFLGWFLAEGSTTKGRIELSLGAHEQGIGQALATTMQHAFGIAASVVIPTRKPTVCKVRGSSAIHADWLAMMCGKGAHGKRLSAYLADRPRALGPLIRGLFRGDGHHNGHGWVLTTVSTALAWQVKAVLAANGVYASVTSRPNSRGFARLDGDPSAAWTVRVGGADARRLAEWSGLRIDKMATSRRPGRSTLHHGGMMFRQVRRIDPAATQVVQDIEVEGAHSFVGQGIVLHNTLHEAMATGLPCVTSDHPGTADYAIGSCVYRLPGKWHRTETQGGEIVTSLYVEPPVLAEAMKRIMAHYPAAARTGHEAAAQAHGWTWEAAAERADANVRLRLVVGRSDG